MTYSATTTGGVSALSGLLLGIGQAFAGIQYAKYQKRVAGANAGLLEYRAEDAISRGETEAQRHEAATRSLIGSQRAAAASQGSDVNSGSALDAQESAAGMGALDALTIRNNAYREAWGYRVEAMNERFRGRFARRAGSFEAGQTLLGSALAGYREYSHGKYIDEKG